jgi:hypothetical protein
VVNWSVSLPSANQDIARSSTDRPQMDGRSRAAIAGSYVVLIAARGLRIFPWQVEMCRTVSGVMVATSCVCAKKTCPMRGVVRYSLCLSDLLLPPHRQTKWEQQNVKRSPAYCSVAVSFLLTRYRLHLVRGTPSHGRGVDVMASMRSATNRRRLLL